MLPFKHPQPFSLVRKRTRRRTPYERSREKKHIELLVQSAGPVFDFIFKRVEAPPATPVVGLENNYPAIGFYGAYPGLSVLDIRALLADRKSQSAATA